jgi:hypothetical protein
MGSRDSDGKAFAGCHICMPDEMVTFYQFIFLEALPLLLVKDNIARIVLIVRDSNSREFNVINESARKSMSSVRVYPNISRMFDKDAVPPTMLFSENLGCLFPSNRCFARTKKLMH